MSYLQLSLPANILVFLVATAVVWMAGTRLVVYGDKLSDRFGLWLGFHKCSQEE